MCGTKETYFLQARVSPAGVLAPGRSEERPISPVGASPHVNHGLKEFLPLQTFTGSSQGAFPASLVLKQHW